MLNVRTVMKVFDCFTFSEERELLLARLRLLETHVDRFVVVEGDQTFRGAKRSLVLPTLSRELAPFSDRIVAVAVDDFPATDDAWARERFQRDAILRGLVDAAPGDLILISDVDEIPRPEVVDRLKATLVGPVALRMHLAYYKVNLRSVEPWTRARAVRFADLGSPQELRDLRDLPELADAGWHLSYLGSTGEIVRKLTSFAHAEYSTPTWTSVRHVKRCIRLGVRLFGHGRFAVVPDTECIPTLPRATHPHLFHPQQSLVERIWARLYEVVATHRGRLPARLADRAPLLVLVPALLLHARRAVIRRWSAAAHA